MNQCSLYIPPDPQLAGPTAANCLLQGVHSERLQLRNNLQVPNQVPLWTWAEGMYFVSMDNVVAVWVVNNAKHFKNSLWFQLDRRQFEETIQTLNNLYAEAEKLGGKSYLEGFLACLTAYTIFLCMETHYEKVNLIQCFWYLYPVFSFYKLKASSWLTFIFYNNIVAVPSLHRTI